MKKLTSLIALAVLCLGAGAASADRGNTSTNRKVRIANHPTVIVKQQTVAAKGYVWVAGHFDRSGCHVTWIPGHYQRIQATAIAPRREEAPVRVAYAPPARIQVIDHRSPKTRSAPAARVDHRKDYDRRNDDRKDDDRRKDYRKNDDRKNDGRKDSGRNRGQR